MGNPSEKFPAPGAPKTKETAGLFPLAKNYIQKLMNQWRDSGDTDSANMLDARIKDLDSGNEYKALEFLEELTPHGQKTNVDEWRLAVNDISSKRHSGKEIMETDQLREFFDREFDQRDNAMAEEVEENPSTYSRKEIIEWQAKNGRWFSAWEQMGQGQGDFRLACQLIEEEIADQLEWKKSNINTMEAYKKHNTISTDDEKWIEHYREQYRKNVLRIEELRKVRNSLYQKYFKK
ncbi:MAG: hypothetical protein WC831_00020 [Parcubacteria group bacterium]|jgi:hypothetical protein